MCGGLKYKRASHTKITATVYLLYILSSTIVEGLRAWGGELGIVFVHSTLDMYNIVGHWGAALLVLFNGATRSAM